MREQRANSTKSAKIFTNDELGELPSLSDSTPSETVLPPVPSSKPVIGSPKSKAGGCSNPNAQRLKAELQSAQQQLEQLRSDLSYRPAVISDGDIDLAHFKSGSSGLNVGAAPVAQSQPLAPERITEVALEEKISDLQKTAIIACESPKDASIQQKLDAQEQELRTLQSEFALDQSAYYSKPDYAEDTAGKARLDAEQQHIQDLQSEIELLKAKLAPRASDQNLSD